MNQQQLTVEENDNLGFESMEDELEALGLVLGALGLVQRPSHASLNEAFRYCANVTEYLNSQGMSYKFRVKGDNFMFTNKWNKEIAYVVKTGNHTYTIWELPEFQHLSTKLDTTGI